MRFQGLFAAIVAVGLVGLTNVNSAEAGLFGHRGCGDCCGPSVVWGGCAPTNCDWCGCESSCCSKRHRGLFKRLFGGCKKRSCCAPEPSCGCESSSNSGCCEVVEPSCGCADAGGGCEPSCGCESSCCDPAPCGKKRHGGLLKRLFRCKKSCGAPSCCAPEPTCGCAAPTCGC